MLRAMTVKSPARHVSLQLPDETPALLNLARSLVSVMLPWFEKQPWDVGEPVTGCSTGFCFGAVAAEAMLAAASSSVYVNVWNNMLMMARGCVDGKGVPNQRRCCFSSDDGSGAGRMSSTMAKRVNLEMRSEEILPDVE